MSVNTAKFKNKVSVLCCIPEKHFRKPEHNRLGNTRCKGIHQKEVVELSLARNSKQKALPESQADDTNW